jgi:site-specific recombinase XerD
MKNKIIAHFHLRRSNPGATSKEAVIYLRITVNGERSEISTDIKIDPATWNLTTERINDRNGRSEAAKVVNPYLNNLISKVDKYLLNDERVTAHQIMCDLKGVSTSTKTLFEAYEYHISSIEKLSGVTYTAATVKKYKYSFNSLKRYTKDVKLTDLGYNFIAGYHDHMRVTEGLVHNSAAKNIKNLYKVINVAIRNKWLADNPFKDYNCTFINPIRHYLTENEIDKLVTKKLTIDRLAKVRDMFVFQIYTGLSFIDMFELTDKNIEIGVDGKEWVVISRKKTGNRLSIPLLPRAKAIIDRYRGTLSNRLLPVCSNQRFNGYLKEIADICNIEKNITSHIGRHTFATTITLSKGIPIETVSKMLGHSSLITTQIYAKVTDRKVAQDMQKLYC